jgi:hypothetical protein
MWNLCTLYTKGYYFSEKELWKTGHLESREDVSSEFAGTPSYEDIEAARRLAPLKEDFLAERGRPTDPYRLRKAEPQGGGYVARGPHPGHTERLPWCAMCEKHVSSGHTH